ncbi:ABC transporter substrate-binding protein [Devosia ginsengisoli]|uniref:Thiamine pyrimidine synthase n=1 Tax=Devosia ginsengisoli TaxID=400770 RepID=A0A5B8LV64_9HYPH|nr:ABC transporter substrate-binding protein [Devosia ginsengisoli]QDZ11966.1 ABC transporter substrate-binding protein [Devosia ginsengisoli]
MMKSPKNTGPLAAGLALAAILSSTAMTPALAQDNLREVVFGLPNVAMTPAFCMFAVSSELGFFAEEGLDVRVQTMSGAGQVAQMLAAGSIEIGGITPEPIWTSIDQGYDFRIVYNLVRLPTGAIGVPADSDINGMEDLAGKRLGVQSLGSSNITLTNALLPRVGVDPGSVQYLAVGVGAQAFQALQAGHVDGLATSDTNFAPLENMGMAFKYFLGPGQEALFSTQVVVNGETVQSDPDFIAGFGRALAKGTAVAIDNPEACIQMMWKRYPDTREIGRSEDEQMAGSIKVLEKRLALMTDDYQAEHGWGSTNPANVQIWNEFATETAIIPKAISDIDTRYTNDFVDAFNDFDASAALAEARAWAP